MVFQSYALYPTLSVADNIGFALEMRKVPKPERKKRIDEVAAMLQIEHLLGRRPRQLSGGQRQRVAMGRALARQPQLFCLTNRCPTWTPSCAWKCAPKSSACTKPAASPACT
jgi:multiple sugar transport system ATP-binding protein